MKLRTGDGVGTAVYIQMGDEPGDRDELLAVFLDPARATLTVEICNGERPPLQEAS